MLTLSRERTMCGMRYAYSTAKGGSEVIIRSEWRLGVEVPSIKGWYRISKLDMESELSGTQI